MTDEQIIEMAKQAGVHIAADVNWIPVIGLEYIKNFAKLVAQHERENFCALLRQLHDSISLQSDPTGLKIRGEA
jgi:hypothetical protein